MRRVFALLPLLLLATFGCNKTVAPGGRSKPQIARSSISLSPSSTELLAAYGQDYPLIGRTGSDNYPLNIKPVEIVCGVKPDYEKIAHLRPGIIAYDSSLFTSADIDKLKRFPCQLVDLNAATIDQFADKLYDLGKLLHAETHISEYVDNIISARTSGMADPLPASEKVAILLPDPAGLGLLAGADSFQADIGKAAGGTIVGPPGDKFVSVNPEAFLQMNPDILVIATTKEAGPKAVEALMKDPRWQSVRAIKNKKIIVLDQDVVLRRGSRVDKFIDSLHRQLKAIG